MKTQVLEPLRKKLFSTRQIQGLYNPTEALLSFWDLKVKVALAKFSQSQIEEMANEI